MVFAVKSLKGILFNLKFLRVFFKFRGFRKPPVPNDTEELDSDVKQEKEMVNYMSSGDFSDYNLVMQNVTKFYGDFLAVNQLCTGIKHSECFGLLGVR